MSIVLKLCDDVRCFSVNHVKCPMCYDLIHLEVPPNLGSVDDYILSTCKNITCFDKSHMYCPSCYRVIHVKI